MQDYEKYYGEYIVKDKECGFTAYSSHVHYKLSELVPIDSHIKIEKFGNPYWPFRVSSCKNAANYITNISELHQILPHLEKIPSGKYSQGLVWNGEDDHSGQIYNPITDTWSWL